MVQVVLFHHVQGLTDGVRALADELGAGGHTVHTPDLFDGQRADTIEAGIALTESIGDEELSARADRAVADLPDDLVLAGISYGGMSAQRLAQTRPGARGLLMYESFVSLTAPWSFGPWPTGLPAQVHGMADDPFFAKEGDLEAAREVAAQQDTVEVFTYAGDGHLFVDRSLPAYDADAVALVVARSRQFLDRLA